MSLTLDALPDVAYALILYRLDYCNALFPNASVCELHQFQMLINTSAHVVSGSFRFDHITDFVKDVLHWLPITQRVYFKVCTLVYKASRGLAPTYLSDLMVKSTGIGNLIIQYTIFSMSYCILCRNNLILLLLILYILL